MKKDIENARSIAEVQKIIKVKIPNLQGEITIIFTDPVAGHSICILNEKGVQVSKISLLGTKGGGVTEIQRISDFRKNIFKDSLIILDTLRLDVARLEEDFDLDEYYFYYSCNGSEERTISVPFNNRKELIITKSIFESCPAPYLAIRLFNGRGTSKDLAASFIFLPDSVMKKTLLEDVHNLVSESIETNPKEIATIMTCYLRQYGHVLFSDLSVWLDQNYFSKLKNNAD